MTHSKVTSKGQITIPKGVREALGIREGDRVAFLVREDHALVRPVPRKSLRKLHGSLPATRPYPGHEEIREEVRAERARRLAGDP